MNYPQPKKTYTAREVVAILRSLRASMAAHGQRILDMGERRVRSGTDPRGGANELMWHREAFSNFACAEQALYMEACVLGRCVEDTGIRRGPLYCNVLRLSAKKTPEKGVAVILRPERSTARS